MPCFNHVLNYERPVPIGIQGNWLLQASYQSAVAYARDRNSKSCTNGSPAAGKKPPIRYRGTRNVLRMLLTINANDRNAVGVFHYVGSQLISAIRRRCRIKKEGERSGWRC